MQKKLSVLNLISVLLVIAVNYSAQVFRFNNTTIGELSKQYANLFTPAGYAFSIWGLIFISLLTYSLFQIRRAFFSSKKSGFILATSYWFFSANLLNVAWVLAFTYDYTGISVLIMFALLFSLLKIVLATNMERWDAPIEIIAFVWWPICLYSGWIAVASIANTSAYLVKIDWGALGLSEITWTIIMIIVAVLVNLFMLVTRNMREFALVGVWALIAIYVKQNTSHPSIGIVALIGIVLLILAVALHGIKNHKTNPVKKLIERYQN
ncbi:tryptophan-rich sensory protein [Aquimarina sp. W85]|uniref:tryptophan-rich sensory protein n=1 Tax=Aquimarina rhodophyticola TaxID=3342246 RepID=UPI0036702759